MDGVPAELRPWLEGSREGPAEGSAGGLPDGRPKDVPEGASHHPAGPGAEEAGPELARRGVEALRRATDAPGRNRDSAFHLLAADAYLTWSSEALLEGPDPEAALRALLRRVADEGP